MFFRYGIENVAQKALCLYFGEKADSAVTATSSIAQSQTLDFVKKKGGGRGKGALCRSKITDEGGLLLSAVRSLRQHDAERCNKSL